MKKLFCILSLAALLTSCVTEKPAIDTREKTIVRVRMQVAPEAITQTRATDQDTIRNLNFYLFGQSNNTVIHTYTESAELKFECTPGEYLVFIAANIHADMGTMTREQLAAYTISRKEDYTDLPMSAMTVVQIEPAQKPGIVTLPPLVVRRNVAKIRYNIVAGASDIRLQSTQLKNIPRTTPLFNASAQSSGFAKDYTDGLIYTDYGKTSQTFYIFENIQGTNNSITSQEQKAGNQAPACATHITVRAMRSNKVLTYNIFLGENNTSSFNVRSNSQQTYNITISGDNSADTRISSYTLDIRDEQAAKNYGGYYPLNSPNNFHIDISGKNAIPVCGELAQTRGPSMSVNGNTGFHEFVLPNLTGRNNFYINFSPAVITRKNAQLKYTLLLYDDSGMMKIQDFEYSLANIVQINVVGKTGIISVTKHLYKEKAGANGLLCLCYEEGCTFHATSSTAEGGMFDGWYSDPACTKLLSTSYTFNYIPTSHHSQVYAKFK